MRDTTRFHISNGSVEMQKADSSYPVVLYVYDLTHGMAKQFAPMFNLPQIEGIWHTGIVVHGFEYYYGGGIQAASPGMTIAGKPLKTIHLGHTFIDQSLLHDYLRDISSQYTPDKYSLLYHNCNHFTHEVALFLLGKGIPEDIVDLPKQVLQTPIGAMLRPVIEGFEQQMRGNSNGVIPWNEQAPSLPPLTQKQQPITQKQEVPPPSGFKPLLSTNGDAKSLFSTLSHINSTANLDLPLQQVTNLVDWFEYRCEPLPQALSIFSNLLSAASSNVAATLVALSLLRLYIAHCAKSISISFLTASVFRPFILESNSDKLCTMSLCALCNLFSDISVAHTFVQLTLKAVKVAFDKFAKSNATILINTALDLLYNSTLSLSTIDDETETILIELVSFLPELISDANFAEAIRERSLCVLLLLAQHWETSVGLLTALEFDPDTITLQSETARQASSQLKLVLNSLT